MFSKRLLRSIRDGLFPFGKHVKLWYNIMYLCGYNVVAKEEADFICLCEGAANGPVFFRKHK